MSKEILLVAGLVSSERAFQRNYFEAGRYCHGGRQEALAR